MDTQKLATAVLVLALAGCSSSKPKPEAAPQPELEIEVERPQYEGRVTLYADGREVGQSVGGLTVRLPAHPWPKLTATIENLCGSRDATVSLTERTPQSQATGSRKQMVAELTLAEAQDPYERVELWVDNRGRPAARLRVNRAAQLSSFIPVQRADFDVEADRATHFSLAYCPSAREVYLDDKLVGKLPEYVKDGRQVVYKYDVKYSRDLLLDTSGKGCYVYTTYCYVKKGLEQKGLEGCSPRSHTYRSQQLHRMPGKIDFFFEPAPKEAGSVYESTELASLNDCRAR